MFGFAVTIIDYDKMNFDIIDCS